MQSYGFRKSTAGRIGRSATGQKHRLLARPGRTQKECRETQGFFRLAERGLDGPGEQGGEFMKRRDKFWIEAEGGSPVRGRRSWPSGSQLHIGREIKRVQPRRPRLTKRPEGGQRLIDVGLGRLSLGQLEDCWDMRRLVLERLAGALFSRHPR